jgi:hypothetical protein
MALAKKPFVVLDAEILSSSVWSEAAHVRLVWLTLLILCDTEGYVGASVPGIATAAGVTLANAEEAIARLMEPDPYSRTKTDEGRRLVVEPRGFRILNFRDHLDRLSAERRKARDRVWRHRQRVKERNAAATTVTLPSPQGVGTRDQGIGNREQTEERKGFAPANPLIAGRRPEMEKEGYRLIREINALEPDREATEILLEAAKWQTKEGGFRSKVRLETMTDDHLIRTIHDLKSHLEEARSNGSATAKQQRA